MIERFMSSNFDITKESFSLFIRKETSNYDLFLNKNYLLLKSIRTICDVRHENPTT